MRLLKFFVVAVLLAPLVPRLLAADAQVATGPRFTITFPKTAHADAITGRVFVAISRTNERTPIQQADTNGVPLFGVNVEALAPGASVTIDATTPGYPLKSLRDVPAGDRRPVDEARRGVPHHRRRRSRGCDRGELGQQRGGRRGRDGRCRCHRRFEALVTPPS